MSVYAAVPFVQLPQPTEAANQKWDDKFTRLFTHTSKDGNSHWNFLSSKTLNDNAEGVQVLPIVVNPIRPSDPQVLLISQHRHTFGLSVPVIELTGGGVKKEQTAESAAREEFLDETHHQYEIDKLALLGPPVATDPAVVRVQAALYAALVHPSQSEGSPTESREREEQDAKLTPFTMPLSVFRDSTAFYQALDNRFGQGKYLISAMVEAARARLLLPQHQVLSAFA